MKLTTQNSPGSDQKDISTLVADIQDLFRSGKAVSVSDTERFGQSLSELISSRLLAYGEGRAGGGLRMSKLGKPVCQLYYEQGEGTQEELSPATLLKFLYGDILELLLLFLAEQAGHKVERQQEEVELDGIIGHIDAVIDNVLVDVKSASSPSFRKFKEGTLQEDDPFGYYAQLAGYATALGGLPGAFLAVDKTLGHITLLEVPAKELQALAPRERIADLRSQLESEEFPGRCFEPVPEGKSGNLKLGSNCSYCPFKFDCWKDANNGIGIRTFLYAKGPVHFVHIEKEPERVLEVTF